MVRQKKKKEEILVPDTQGLRCDDLVLGFLMNLENSNFVTKVIQENSARSAWLEEASLEQVLWQ